MRVLDASGGSEWWKRLVEAIGCSDWWERVIRSEVVEVDGRMSE